MFVHCVIHVMAKMCETFIINGWGHLVQLTEDLLRFNVLILLNGIQSVIAFTQVGLKHIHGI